jgi:hypothetical protein
MKYAVLPVLLASGLFSGSLIANDSPAFTFAEAFYVQSDSNYDLDTKGLGIKGSYELSDYFFVEANYAQTSGDIVNVDVDYDTFQYGLGAKYDFDNAITVFASYNLGDWKVKSKGNSKNTIDVDTIKLGLRSQVSKLIELNAALTSTDIEYGDRESGFVLGGNYKFSDTWHVTAEFSRIAGEVDLDQLSLGIRKTF